MAELKGISASPGIVTGKAFVYKDDNPQVPKYDIHSSRVPLELERLRDALDKAAAEIEDIKKNHSRDIISNGGNFLDSHLMMLRDPEFKENLARELRDKLKNIEWILYRNMQALMDKLGSSEDPYLRERAADIHDVSRRILNHLMFREQISLADLTDEVILVGRDLMPSEAMAMNQKKVLGLAMEEGGRTSHTAILARAFGIPAVLGLRGITRLARNGDEVLIDGNRGLAFVNPDEATKSRYRKTQALWHRREEELHGLNSLPAETRDGKKIGLLGNIEIPEEVESLRHHGAEGIGLYRSEFLFLQPGRLPSEEAQCRAYGRVLEAMEGKSVTIRTLDLGGDKMSPEMADSAERNPLLGWRAIRFCLSRTRLFQTQLRALFRASVRGKLKIMFPMISGVEELEEALFLVDETRKGLRSEGIPFDEEVEVGIMIETPSAAVTSDILADKASFFSIGTNDLIQYAIAVDRGNHKVAYLYEPFHPGVLRLIAATIRNAHQRGIRVALCGEMAGDPLATVILLGLGLDEFSMSASSIPEVKKIIRSVTTGEAEEFARRVMEMTSCREIDAFIRRHMEEKFDVLSY